MRAALVAAAAVACLALGGCATKLSPSDTVQLLDAFARAGCTGDAHASIGGATGQLGGGAHAEASVNGSCDATKAVPANPVNPSH